MVEMPAAGLSLSESHPLSEELSSLRALVARFQNEAHTASINLQRHALDTSAYTARIAQLEAENKLLRAELGVLRDNPAPSPSSSLQSGAPSSVFSSAFSASSTANAEEAREKERETVAELTLALRALSAKHTLALASLSTATQSLTEATLRTRQAEHTADEAYALAARRRAREAELEDALRERGEEVERAREEARRSDAVVREYAGLRGRTSFALGHTRGVSGSGSVDAGSTPTLVEPASSSFAPAPGTTNGDADAKPNSDLEADPTDALDWEKRVAELTASCTKLELALAASHTLVAELGTELARAKYEREVARIEDGGAGAVVERYMCVYVESLPVAPTTTTAFSRFRAVFGAPPSASILRGIVRAKRRLECEVIDWCVRMRVRLRNGNSKESSAERWVKDECGEAGTRQRDETIHHYRLSVEKARTELGEGDVHRVRCRRSSERIPQEFSKSEMTRQSDRQDGVECRRHGRYGRKISQFYSESSQKRLSAGADDGQNAPEKIFLSDVLYLATTSRCLSRPAFIAVIVVALLLLDVDTRYRLNSSYRSCGFPWVSGVRALAAFPASNLKANRATVLRPTPDTRHRAFLDLRHSADTFSKDESSN
ncbi:hypothetical protein B0H14DRAFT_3176037 [Mycena olivaceomarginata]|nr:hypothetical protein B0H14DRAFT_3176037 [Mycena olivaceomarginata]